MLKWDLNKLKRWRAFDIEELRIIASKLGDPTSKEEETIFKDAFEAFCERQGIQPQWDKESEVPEDDDGYPELTTPERFERLRELNKKLDEANGEICEGCQAELVHHRSKLSEEFLPLIELLIDAGVLSVMIPSGKNGDPGCEFREIEDVFDCDHGVGIHLVTEGSVEDEMHEHANLLN